MWPHVLMEIFHWFNIEYWATSWPNIFAPSVWTLLGIVIADIRSVRRHRQMNDHHVSKVNDLAGQIESLTDRLVELIGGSANDDE